MTGVTGVVSVQHLCVFTRPYLDRGGAAPEARPSSALLDAEGRGLDTTRRDLAIVIAGRVTVLTISLASDVIDRIASAADPLDESYQLAREQAAHALSLPGIAGIHITDFRHDDSVHRLVHDLRLGPAFHLISASLANFASGMLVIPITSAFHDLYKLDSAKVENCGPSITI